MKLNVIVFPERMFTIGEHFDFICEASTMENRHLQPLHSDALDVGFAIERNNGQRVTLTFTGVRKNGEGEVQAWEYYGTDGSQAVVFND